MNTRERIVDYLRRRTGRDALSPSDAELEQEIKKMAQRSDAPHRRSSKRLAAKGEKRGG